jgi:signal peptidase I
MKYIPALALAVLVVFAVRGVVSGTPIIGFPALLLLAVVICGVAWAWDKFFLAKKRPAGELAHWGIEVPASIFWVLLIVFLLRSFVAEPFRIPSSSMRPGLVTGDFILVNKFTYGIRLPVLDTKVLPIGEPKRGDVAVFKAPHEPEKDFIKRIIGVPGDVIEYDQQKGLVLNSKRVEQREDGTYSWIEAPGVFPTTIQKIEVLDGRSYKVIQEVHKPAYGAGAIRETVEPRMHEQRREDAARRAVSMGYSPANTQTATTPVPTCTDSNNVLVCRVPPGHYLALGDNRDNSDDGRYWGFIPDSHLRGKAFFIWFNWDDVSSFSFKRVFSGIQ